MTIERPPQHIIDYFYKLSDYNPDIRLKAASKLIQDEVGVFFMLGSRSLDNVTVYFTNFRRQQNTRTMCWIV